MLQPALFLENIFHYKPAIFRMHRGCLLSYREYNFKLVLENQVYLRIRVSTKKRCITWVWQVMLYLGQNEGFCPGDSTSDGSEELLREVLREGQHIRFWWRGTLVQSSTWFTRGFLLGMRRWCHHEGCFSGYEEMQGLGSRRQFLKISI